MDLEQIVETEAGRLKRWARFDAGSEGFDVEIEYVSRQNLEAMRKKCMKTKWRGHQRVDELDDERFFGELSKRILNWKGLNGKVLRQMFPLKNNVQLNGAEVECTDSNKRFMLKQAYGFYDFIFRELTELHEIESEQIDGELKNSDALSPQS